jgi:hypothetical protein
MATMIAEGGCMSEVLGDHTAYGMLCSLQRKWYCSCKDHKGKIQTVAFGPSNILEHKSPGIVLPDPTTEINKLFKTKTLSKLTSRRDIYYMMFVLDHKLGYYRLFPVCECQCAALLAPYEFTEHA